MIQNYAKVRFFLSVCEKIRLFIKYEKVWKQMKNKKPKKSITKFANHMKVLNNIQK